MTKRCAVKKKKGNNSNHCRKKNTLKLYHFKLRQFVAIYNSYYTVYSADAFLKALS